MNIFLGFIAIIVGGVVLLRLLQRALSTLPKFGIASKTLRGEKVKSRAEKKVADFLYLNGIVYEYEKSIRLGGKRYRPDFYLPEFDMYVEYRGLVGHKDYDAYRKKKIQEYADHDLRRIGLQHEDIRQLHHVLRQKIEAVHGSAMRKPSLRKRMLRFLFAAIGVTRR